MTGFQPTAAGITQLEGDVTAGPGHGEQNATLQPTENVITLIETYGGGGNFQTFNVIAFGADRTDTVDSSTAIAAAYAAATLAAPSVLLFPAGTYRISPGNLTRNSLAQSQVAFLSSGRVELDCTGGNGVFLDNTLKDPAYWSSVDEGVHAPPAPIGTFILNGTNATSGAIGFRNSIAIGQYCDVFAEHFKAAPDSTWPTSGNPGAIGILMENTVDTNSVARWTEETRFGPNSGFDDCYIGLMFDSNNGSNSFGYTKMPSFRVRAAAYGQRGIVVRSSSSSNPCNFYNSQLSWLGNLGPETTTLPVGTFTGTLSGATVSLAFSGLTTVACYDGEILILTDSTGLIAQAVMVQGNNPIGSSAIACYQFTPIATFASGTVIKVATGLVVGWPNNTYTGWSSGIATDASALQTSTIDWETESGGGAVLNVCSIFVSSTASLAYRGTIDVGTYAGNSIVQEYGTITLAEGRFKATGRDSHTGIIYPHIAGGWYPYASGFNSVLLAANVPHFTPLIVGKRHAFNNVGSYVVTGGSTGATLRFAIYQDNGNGYPGALIFDGGEIAATSSAAIAEAALTLCRALQLEYVWIGVVGHGSPVTYPTLRGVATVSALSTGYLMPQASPAAGTQFIGYIGGTVTVTGAWPATMSTGLSLSNATAFCGLLA